MELCGPHVAISPVMLRPSDIELHTAVKRLSSDLQPAGGFRPEEALEVETALSLFTHGGAYAEFAEKEKGLLCEGGLADFVVFDKNPLKVEPDAIKDIVVLQTIKDGVAVFVK